jgi:hypothetical protein
MPRREKEPTERFHLHLYSSDIEWLKSTFGDRVGVAKAVRQMIRGYRLKVEARVADLTDAAPAPPPQSLEDLGV